MSCAELAFCDGSVSMQVHLRLESRSETWAAASMLAVIVLLQGASNDIDLMYDLASSFLMVPSIVLRDAKDRQSSVLLSLKVISSSSTLMLPELTSFRFAASGPLLRSSGIIG